MGELSEWYLALESRKLTEKTGVEHGARRRHWYETSVNHLVALLGLGTLLVLGEPAHGLSLNDQIENQLDNNCGVLLDRDNVPPWGIIINPPPDIGSELLQICALPDTGSGVSTGASGALQAYSFAPSAAIEGRLSRARHSEDKTGVSSAAIVEQLGRAQDGEDETGAQDGEDETGASSDDIDIGGGISLFVTGEYEEQEKDETSFQDETDSDNTTLTIGADYRFSEKLVGGMALNVRNEDGDFKSGGGFDNDTLGVFFYASFLPAERFFVDVVVGYSSIDLDIERNPSYEVFDENGNPDGRILSGTAKSDDADADEVTASLLLGYDYPMGKYTVGPRAGIQWKQTDFDSYDETGDSGLELRYEDHTITSRRIVLGLFASTSISTGSAVLVPQITVDYINETEDDRDSITASFVEDLRGEPKKFKFETDDRESEWLEIGIGLVAVFPNDVQAFANYSAYAENDLYDSWTASVGARLSF
jgi:outer membrane autotransporter protein